MSLGIACGVPLKAIVAGIEAVDIVPGRCEIIDEGQPFAVVVSASANATAAPAGFCLSAVNASQLLAVVASR